MKTVFFTSIRGDYNGETAEMLTDLLQLRITTYKNYNRELVTMAQVGKRQGISFIFELFKDFNKTIHRTQPKRITKKLIEEQHNNAVAHFEEIKQLALAHYDLELEAA